ncbi:MAG: archaellin/type IV pilin N-terminal domain-containing protein [archaeon]
MINKKAQSQIITTVLIILLVLAAIVIVWQVVNNTIKGGADQVDKQSTCLGIAMEVTSVDATHVNVKRTGGGTLTGTGVVYIENGVTATYPGSETFADPMDSEQILVTSGATVEVALKLSDGTVCPISGVATATA